MLLVESAAGVAVLTLDRPTKGNALDEPLVEALFEAIDGAITDEEIHTLVLASSSRNFCTGFDLSDLAAQSDGDLLRRFVAVEELLATLWHAPIRTVAITCGRAWGAGADLLACCDQRLAAPDATFTFPGARFGLVLGTRRLASVVGDTAALQIVGEGAVLDAPTAEATGLVTAIVPEGLDVIAWVENDLPPLAIDRMTYAELKSAMRPDRRDEDLAAMVRSAAWAGLKERIEAYRASTRQSPR